MELVEIRDLDGPNLFALVPTIKLEVIVSPGDELPVARQAYITEHTNHYVSVDPLQALSAVVAALHQHLKLAPPQPVIHALDTPNHFAICFPWEKRATARAIARTGFELIAGERIASLSNHLSSAIRSETDAGEVDHPTWVRDSERRFPAAAITGTNGKTTTTRLLAHILRHAGNRVGWSSSSGVYIAGEQVIDGDYTGHGGARRVLTDTEIDCAVLETARGGILLRGLGYESNDVGVFLNVSEDHLNLHGVLELETLARVKSTVVRTTRPEGIVILNADDPIVLARRDEVKAEVMLISQNTRSPQVQTHLRSGGRAVVLDQGEVTFYTGEQRIAIVPIAEVPLSYGGMARHMVENALAACAAAIGMRVGQQSIREAMRTFHPDRDHNSGRLNVFELDGRTVIVDFAHNESGLKFLLDFGRHLVPGASQLTAIVGTAGDRGDSVFIGLGRIAGQFADKVLVKSNPGYLRGRSPEETVGLVLEGIRQAGASVDATDIYTSEYDAAVGAIERAHPGEVIVIMCVEDYLRIIEDLIARGAQERRTTYA